MSISPPPLGLTPTTEGIGKTRTYHREDDESSKTREREQKRKQGKLTTKRYVFFSPPPKKKVEPPALGSIVLNINYYNVSSNAPAFPFVKFN